MTVSNSTQYNKASAAGVRNGLLYLLVGSGIGAAVALLFAPKSGTELRSDITDMTRKGYDGTLELAGTLKAQSTDLLHTLKEKKDQAYDFAVTKLSRAEAEAKDAVETAVDRINGEMRQLDDNASQKSSGTGRRSSSIL